MMDFKWFGDAIYLIAVGAFFSFLVMVIWVSLAEQDYDDDDWAPWDLPEDKGDDDVDIS